MSDGRDFAAWFRQQLKRREWNQSDAARKLGVSSGVVSRWYRGDRLPDPKSCDLIADLFVVPVDMVLELAGHRPASVPIPPDSPVVLLQSLVERVDWNPDRTAAIEGILRGFIERDRKQSG
jgi:transcriptional regulator with XRE-family HTH domain